MHNIGVSRVLSGIALIETFESVTFFVNKKAIWYYMNLNIHS